MDNVLLSALALLYLTPAAFSVYHALLYKRDSRAAMGWIMACIFVPYGGPVAYFLFGINRVKTRARDIKRHLFNIEYEGSGKNLAPKSTEETGLTSIGFRITGRPLSTGNRVQTLYNGDEAYPAMLDAINGAEEEVLFTSYILKSDQTGQAFIDALKSAHDRGVSVKILIDGIGEWYTWPRSSKLLRKIGVPHARFLPPSLFPPSFLINLRNHRKLLIVDRDLAFAGGMNIGDNHTTLPDQPREVTDVHFGLRGPVVDDLARVFFEDWSFSTNEKAEFEPRSKPCEDGDANCRVIPDGPDEALDALAFTIDAVIAGSEKSVDIMTPYFLPSRELVSSLHSAALRGVRVRIVLPGKNNLFYVHWANRNLLGELTKWGIEIYYQPPPFCHSKLLCVDYDYSMIGSANLDPRSLRLNFEIGVEVFSAALNRELRSHFDATVATCTRVTRQSMTGRSVPVRLRDSFVSLFAPYF